MIYIIAHIALIVVAFLLGWYLSGRIVQPAKEKRESGEAFAETVKKAPKDLWQGFANAHDRHPPAFKENDSWGSDIS